MSGNQPGGARSSPPGGARGALGAALRELRTREGLSGVALAARLAWVQSKISRIETGRQLPTEEDLTAWAVATGAADDAIVALRERLRSARAEHAPWRRGAVHPGQSGTQRGMLDAASEAALIRNFEVGVVPGLLQTADYARARLAENVEFHGAPAGDLEEALLLRIQRQQVLYDSTKRFQFVITESVLRMVLCPVDVMRGQLDRLAALIGLSNIELGVIPAGSRLPLAPLHGFVMFDDAVTVETWAEEQTLRNAADTDRFGAIFDQLRRAARYGEQVRPMLAGAIAQLRAPA
nr:helix-turn-helix transcriptional regulator [Micromonospora sp. DSM 115978]